MRISHLALLASTFWLLGASDCTTSKPEYRDLTIFHTNDIHSHFRPEAPGSEKNPYGLGGLARLKTLVDQVRADKPASLLLDAGDWSEGTMYYNTDAGSNALRILDKIGYDAVAAGNHDWLNHPYETALTIERAGVRFPVLGANKNLTDVWNGERVSRVLRDYTIFEFGDLRVGIIGLLTDEFLYYEYFKPGVITPVLSRASELSQKLHDEEKCDIIILLSHNDIALNIELAKLVPWVNVVVSGHHHAKTSKPIEVKVGDHNVYVVEAKEWAQFLGELNIRIDKRTGHIITANYKLHPVSSELLEDGPIADMIDEQDRLLNVKYNHVLSGDKSFTRTPIANTSHELTHDDSGESALTNFIAEAMRVAANADLGLESGKLAGVGVAQGPLTALDLANIAPHIYGPIGSAEFPKFGATWTIKRLSISGLQLRGLLNLVFYANNLGLPLGPISASGLTATYSASAATQASATREILIRGEPLKNDKVYSVALHDGLLLALRILGKKLSLAIDFGNPEETGIETWHAALQHGLQLGDLNSPSLAPGQTFLAVEQDLALYEHSVEVVRDPTTGKPAVDVTVINQSIVESLPNELQIFSSAPNDAVGDSPYGDINERVALGDRVAVPSIPARSSVKIRVPWNTTQTGMFGLRAMLHGKDAQSSNNQVLVHRALSTVP